MTPERILWQTVVWQAFIDATWQPTSWEAPEHRRAKQLADDWIRGCGKTFRRVCAYADLDPHFLSQAYVAGRVNAAGLRAHLIRVNHSVAKAPKTPKRGARRGQVEFLQPHGSQRRLR